MPMKALCYVRHQRIENLDYETIPLVWAQFGHIQGIFGKWEMY